jgi:hypothetical protein
MAQMRTTAPCPYCGTTLVLRDCPIVATNVDPRIGRFAGRRGGEAEPVARPPSGASAVGVHFGRPVLWRRPERERVSGTTTFIRHAVKSIVEDPRGRQAVVRDFPPEDRPALACTKCGAPLPDDIGERPILTIGIIGTTSAGKSHFLASLVRDGAQRQGLAPWGFDEFVLDETSADTFRADYQGFFHNRMVLKLTAPGEAHQVRDRPLAVRTALSRESRGDTPVTLLFHDFAGETLLQRIERTRHAAFLSRAAALVFLIDPLMIEPIRKRLKGEFGGENYYNQADLVNACIADLGTGRAARTPIAIALSKSDLLETAVPEQDFTFRRPPSRDLKTAMQQMRLVNGEVRGLLGAAGAHDLLAAADRLGPRAPVSFHAVAPIGREPAAGAEGGRAAVSEVKPLRCLDPIINILLSMCSADRVPGR